VNQILANPYVAATCGALIGFACIAGVAVSPRFVRSGGAKAATGVMMGAMALSMLVIMTVLLAFVLISPQSFVWFGISLAAGFVIGLAVMGVWLVRAMGQEDQGR